MAGLPPLSPSRRKKASNKFIPYHSKRKFKPNKSNFEPNNFYSKNKFRKNWSNKPNRQQKNKLFHKSKTKCFKCNKTGHFANNCPVKNTINQLKISQVEKENLIQTLELRNTDSEDEMSKDDITLMESSSHESNEHSSPDINFGC